MQLLVEHVDSLAPEDEDPLREILDDIGEVPTVEDMIGENQLVFSNLECLITLLKWLYTVTLM